MNNLALRIIVMILFNMLLTLTADVAAQSVPSAEILQSHLNEFSEWKTANTGGVDFRVKNLPHKDGNMTSVALVVADVHKNDARTILADPDSWCGLLFLHLNVKACIYNDTPGDQWVKLYMGRKFYQPPEKAEALQLAFKTGANSDGVIWAEMTAAEGPYGTSDYYIGLYAIQADTGVYTELLSSQKIGNSATAAQNLYFATLAAKKVGFSVVGKDWRGRPEYVRGAQGALERNVVRYLLALEIYLRKHDLEGLAGSQVRAADWYDATTQYKKQLYEVDRDDYLKAKSREYSNQMRLQSAITKSR